MFDIYSVHTIKQEALNEYLELTPDEAFNSKAYFSITPENLKDKILDLVAFYKNLESSQEQLGHAMEELESKSTRLAKQIESVKGHIKELLNDAPGNKARNAIHSATLCAPQPKLTIVNESLIPENFIKKTLISKVDKEAINRIFKDDGEIVPGCAVVERRDLRIS